MPTGVLLLVRLIDGLDNIDINVLRRDILIASDPDDFYFDGPLTRYRIPDDWDGPDALGRADDPCVRLARMREWWLNVNLLLAYYGPGYERGHLPTFIRLAEWLEHRIPECEIWYGHDSCPEAAKPFGARERAELFRYYVQVGHKPYDDKRKSVNHGVGEPPSDQIKPEKRPW